MTARRRRPVVVVCHFCGITLQPAPFYSAIHGSFGFPVGVGWRICTPACPGRPSGAVVVVRGLGVAS